jgi:hypothetical protein
MGVRQNEAVNLVSNKRSRREVLFADSDGEVYHGTIRTERRNCVAQTTGSYLCDFYDIGVYSVRKNGVWSREERARLVVKQAHSKKGDTVL